MEVKEIPLTMTSPPPVSRSVRERMDAGSLTYPSRNSLLQASAARLGILLRSGDPISKPIPLRIRSKPFSIVRGSRRRRLSGRVHRDGRVRDVEELTAGLY